MLFEELQNFGAAGLRCVSVRAAVRIRKRNMFDAAEQRSEPFALRIFRRRERKRTERAPVEAAIKRNELVALASVPELPKNTFLASLPGIVATSFSASCGMWW